MGRSIRGLGAAQASFGLWIVCELGLGGYAKSALAADSFHVTPALTVGETFTDNAGLSTGTGAAVSSSSAGPARADVITTISPSLDLLSQGAHVQLGLIYDPQELIFARGTSTDTLQQRLQGNGHAELWPETLFFDARSSIDQEYVSGAGPIANTTLTTNNNLQTVQAYSASPSVRHHFGSFADSETRYTFSQISTGGGTVAPSQIQEATQTVTSGDRFGRFGWTWVADGTENERQGGTSDPLSGTTTKDYWSELNLSYRIYRGLKILGGAGYERFSDPTLTNQGAGIIYDGGFQIDPSPRTSATLTYQRRFGIDGFNFNGHYDIGPKLRALASYSQTVQTGQSQIANNLNNQGLSQSGVIVNTQTGLPFTAGNGFGGIAGSPLGISSQAFVDKVFSSTLQMTSGRNTYIGTAFYERQIFEMPSGANTSYGGTVGWSRQLWPLLSSNLYTSVGQTDGSGNGSTAGNGTFYTISANLTYALSPSVTAQFTATRSSSATSSSSDRTDVDTVGISVSKKF